MVSLYQGRIVALKKVIVPELYYIFMIAQFTVDS
jgi:hypothetical protein